MKFSEADASDVAPELKEEKIQEIGETKTETLENAEANKRFDQATYDSVTLVVNEGNYQEAEETEKAFVAVIEAPVAIIDTNDGPRTISGTEKVDQAAIIDSNDGPSAVRLPEVINDSNDGPEPPYDSGRDKMGDMGPPDRPSGPELQAALEIPGEEAALPQEARELGGSDEGSEGEPKLVIHRDGEDDGRLDLDDGVEQVFEPHKVNQGDPGSIMKDVNRMEDGGYQGEVIAEGIPGIEKPGDLNVLDGLPGGRPGEREDLIGEDEMDKLGDKVDIDTSGISGVGDPRIGKPAAGTGTSDKTAKTADADSGSADLSTAAKKTTPTNGGTGGKPAAGASPKPKPKFTRIAGDASGVSSGVASGKAMGSGYRGPSLSLPKDISSFIHGPTSPDSTPDPEGVEGTFEDPLGKINIQERAPVGAESLMQPIGEEDFYRGDRPMPMTLEEVMAGNVDPYAIYTDEDYDMPDVVETDVVDKTDWVKGPPKPPK